MSIKDIKKFIYIIAVFMILVLPISANAASYTFSYSAYKCSGTSATNLQDCRESYYAGSLTKLGSGASLNPGEDVMLVLEYSQDYEYDDEEDGPNPNGYLHAAHTFTTKTKYNTGVVTPLKYKQGMSKKDAIFAALDNNNPVFKTYNAEIDDNFLYAVSQWSEDVSVANITGDSVNKWAVIGYTGKGTETFVYNPGAIGFMFFKVNEDATGGADIDFILDGSTGDATVLSDIGSQPISWTQTPLKLKVAGSSLSDDTSMQSLTSTDNNGNIINLVASGTNLFTCNAAGTSCETDMVFANSVTSINLAGLTNHANAQFNPQTVSGDENLKRYNKNHSLSVGNNDITFKVIAEDNNTETTYTIHAYRLSHDATLSTMTMTNQTVGFTFDRGTKTYNPEVPFATKNTVLAATTYDPNATITSTLGAKALTNYGTGNPTVITVTVEAEDCKSIYATVANNANATCGRETYTVNVTRKAPNNEARLTRLKVDNVTLSGFDKDTHTYNWGIARYNKSTATFSYEAVNTTTSIDGVKYFRKNSDGTETELSSATVNLNTGANFAEGENTFIVRVYAEGYFEALGKGDTANAIKEDYEVKFHRNSNIALLDTLAINSNISGSMAPAFTDNSFEGPYVYTYNPATTSINITATTSHDAASIGVGTTNYNQSLNLDVTDFSKTVNVVVTAEDGNKKTYVINFVEDLSTDNTLSSLSLTGASLNETFPTAGNTYTSTVAGTVEKVTVNAELNEPNAKFYTAPTGEYYGPREVTLNYGTNRIEVRVQSQAQWRSGSSAYNTYTITVTKKQKDIKTLTSLSIDGDDIGNHTVGNVPFASDSLDTTEYTVEPFDYSKASVTITAVTTDHPDATYKVFNSTKTTEYINGEISLNTGNTDIVVEVTAQDNTKQDYLIHLTRNKNNNANVSSVTVFGTGAVWNEESNAYIITVPNSRTTLTASDVVITPVDSNAHVTKLTGTISLLTKVDNEFLFEVLPENEVSSDKKSYKIIITRELSTDNTLQKVRVVASDGKGYECNTFSNYACTIEVPSTTTSYTLTATPNYAGAYVTGNGNFTMGGANDSEQVKQVSVRAEADEESGVVQVYNITIVRGKSSDADLQYIKIDNTIIRDDDSTIFNKDKTNYTVTLLPDPTTGITQGTIDLDALVDDVGKAELTVKKNNSATELGSQTLAYGNTTFEFTVKAENNSTKTYNLTVVRSNNNNAYLTDIAINGTSINTMKNDFSKTTYSYTYSNYTDLGASNIMVVPYTTGGITITATKEDTDHGQAYLINNGTDAYVKLSTGENTITVTGVAQDGSKRNYQLKVYRNKNTNNTLTSITVAGIPATAISTETDTDGVVIGYRVTVPNSVTKLTKDNVAVTLPATTNNDDPAATVVKPDLDLSTQTVNEYAIAVQSEAGQLRTYNVHVTREKSNVNTLESLIVKGAVGTTEPYTYNISGAFTPSFNKNNTSDSYTVKVPANVTKIQISYERTDNTATVTGAGTKTLPTIINTDNPYVVDVVVTPEDENPDHARTYHLNIERESSVVSTLSDIQVSVGDTSYTSAMTPSFTADVRNYYVEVPGGTTSVLITPTLTDSRATIVEGNKYDTAQSVVPGNNTFEINVQAEAAGSTPTTYTVVVKVLPKSDNTLSDLKVNGTTVTGFDPDITEYTLNDVENNISTITIGATANDSDATITTALGTKTLKTGNNDIVVTVEAQDGTPKNYHIYVIRKKSSNANLKTLNVSGATILPHNNPFDPDELNYRVELESTTEVFSPTDVTALPEESTSSVVKDPALSLTTGENGPYKITVTAEDGTTEKVYNITVVRKQSSDARLKSVTLNNASITPSFTSDNTVYTLSIPATATEFTIEGIPVSPGANVEGDGTFGKDKGTVIIKVTSEDESTVKNYTFNIATAESTDATLSYLEAVGYNFLPTGTTFTSTNMIYDIGNIDYGVRNININAVTTNPNATMKYYVNDVEQENNIVSLPQEYGQKNIKVVVTPANRIDSDARTYIIKYNMQSSKNNYLSKLEVSSGTLTPTFNKATTEYTVNVPYDTTEISFSLVTEDPNATVSDNASNYTYTSADLPKTYEYTGLAVGQRTFTFYVKAANQAVKTYTVKVIRRNQQPSEDATLSSLSVTSHPFDIEFDPTETNYTISDVRYTGEDELVVNAIANNNGATITYYLNGVVQSSNVIDISNTVGDNVIGVHVIAEDNETPKDYQINYTRNPSNNAYLDSIVDEFTQITTFEHDDFGPYTISVLEDTATFVVTFTPQDQNATISIKGQSHRGTWQYSVRNLVYGENTIPITVTPESGNNPLTYMLKVTRASNTELITSNEYGHTIEDGMIKTAVLNETSTDLKNELDNDNSKLQLWDKDDNAEIGNDSKLATGQTMKLVKSGVVVDSKRVVVKGDTNGDGKISLFDAVAVVNHYISIRNSDPSFVQLDEPYLTAGDYNNDSRITLFDASSIVSKYLEGRS